MLRAISVNDRVYPFACFASYQSAFGNRFVTDPVAYNVSGLAFWTFGAGCSSSLSCELPLQAQGAMGRFNGGEFPGAAFVAFSTTSRGLGMPGSTAGADRRFRFVGVSTLPALVALVVTHRVLELALRAVLAMKFVGGRLVGTLVAKRTVTTLNARGATRFGGSV